MRASIYAPTLTYGRELWVVAERTRMQIIMAEMSFHRRVAGLNRRAKVLRHLEGANKEPVDAEK